MCNYGQKTDGMIFLEELHSHAVQMSAISWNVFPASLNGITKGWSFAANVLPPRSWRRLLLMFLEPAVPKRTPCARSAVRFDDQSPSFHAFR